MEPASPRAPTPFWHRVPELFLLPLKPPAIVVTLVATVFATMGFIMDGGLGLLLYLGANIGLLYYGRALLVSSAAGEHEPPPLELPQDGWLTPIKLWMLFSFPFFLALPLYLFF